MSYPKIDTYVNVIIEPFTEIAARYVANDRTVEVFGALPALYLKKEDDFGERRLLIREYILKLQLPVKSKPADLAEFVKTQLLNYCTTELRPNFTQYTSASHLYHSCTEKEYSMKNAYSEIVQKSGYTPRKLFCKMYKQPGSFMTIEEVCKMWDIPAVEQLSPENSEYSLLGEMPKIE